MAARADQRKVVDVRLTAERSVPWGEVVGIAGLVRRTTEHTRPVPGDQRQDLTFGGMSDPAAQPQRLALFAEDHAEELDIARQLFEQRHWQLRPAGQLQTCHLTLSLIHI